MPPEHEPPPLPPPVLRATYRLQFSEHFRLTDARALAPYLADLGISHVCASPLFKARPHSPHGYDVCDFSELNPELGTEEDLKNFATALHDHGMGLVLDIVPNHMGVGGPENRWWWDVLTHGPASRFADYFDIDWKPPSPQLRDKVLVPVLGDRFDRVLQRGELRLAREAGAYVLRYFEHRLPMTPESLPATLRQRQDQPAVAEVNANPGVMKHLLEHQHYILSDWHAADTELNYRRFFNVPTLAGIRVEDGQVFNATHELIRRWLAEGWVDGLRVDHPDGLRDPEQYLCRLRLLAPDAWIVVEKILQPDETLPASWPVDGTTGYDFLNLASNLFIDPDGEKPLTDFYAEFTGEPVDYGTLCLEKRRLVLRGLLAAEVNRLTELLCQVAPRDRGGERFKREELREALTELAATMPVYRTYVRPDSGNISATDEGLITQAVGQARKRRPDLDPAVFDFLEDLLRLRRRGSAESDIVLRFQQLTAPAMAKGVEDTAFYCFNRLIGLNEVGGDPGQFGTSVETFHENCRHRQQQWPEAMLATSTHDTKRSEDVRARLSLLAEIPETWRETVHRWSGMNERHRRGGWPDRNAEYLFYQTVVGAWPLTPERALAFMEKAVREAKQQTNWNQPNEPYETALRGFVTDVMNEPQFRIELEKFVMPLVKAGWVNSLAQTLLKLTAPGVPDFYQRCELWDGSLTDPDNRRPVDFELRRRLLAEMKDLSLEQVVERRSEGLPKLWLIQRALSLRRDRPDLFDGEAGYQPLEAQGAKAGHLVAFARGDAAITVVPRLVLRLKEEWDDTQLEIPRGSWRNVLTGDDVAGGGVFPAELLRRFPVALLVRREIG